MSDDILSVKSRIFLNEIEQHKFTFKSLGEEECLKIFNKLTAKMLGNKTFKDRHDTHRIMLQQMETEDKPGNIVERLKDIILNMDQNESDVLLLNYMSFEIIYEISKEHFFSFFETVIYHPAADAIEVFDKSCSWLINISDDEYMSIWKEA